MGLATGYNACLITIGNEILIGRIINTNMAWLGKKLTFIGYKVIRGIIAPDIIEEIAWAFNACMQTSPRVIISTGGLGPTFDDKTSEGLATAFNLSLVLNQKALEMVKEKYSKKGLEITPARKKMALLPEGAEPLPNPVGTAPGIHLVIDNTHIFALPGVPSEMKAIYEQSIESLLIKIGPKISFVEQTIRSIGLPESGIAPILDKIMKKYHGVYIKSHPRGKELGKPLQELHITASGKDKNKAQKLVEEVTQELAEELSRLGAKIEYL